MQIWQLQEAKARFYELVQRANEEGPQEITVNGRSLAAVVSRKAFHQLSGAGETLMEFMQRSPLRGLDDLVFERDPSPVREVNGDDATAFIVGD